MNFSCWEFDGTVVFCFAAVGYLTVALQILHQCLSGVAVSTVYDLLHSVRLAASAPIFAFF
jgi:hypothetical protein